MRPATALARFAAPKPPRHSVALTWSSSAPTFQIFRVSGNPRKPNWKPIGSSATPAYTDPSLNFGKIYTYTVTALDTQGNQSGYATPVTVTIPAQ